MEDTRVGILEELEAWAHDGTASKVCWLNGHPGTGKTTVAHSLRAPGKAEEAWSQLLLLSLVIEGRSSDHPYDFRHAFAVYPQVSISQK
jgi:adenylylsulfate kinase-like enzyme